MEWLESHAQLAGWLQAIGGILSIIAAFLVANRQARQALKHQHLQAAERLRSLSRLFQYWCDTCRKSHALRACEDQTRNVGALNLNRSEFNDTANEINKFNFLDAQSSRFPGADSLSGDVRTTLEPYESRLRIPVEA